MADFSATDAALVGFRFVRENLRAVAVWAVCILIFSALFAVLLEQMAGPALMAAQALGPKPDPAESMALFRQLGPVYLLMFVIGYAFYAVVLGAMNRAVLRPDDDRAAYLRVGRDEVRQLLLLLIATVVGAGLYLGLVLLVAMVAVGGGLAIHNTGATALLTLVAAIAAACGLVFFWVRLSLASALTFDTGRVNLFGSWALTRGRFWKLFGCYLISFVLYVVLGLLALIILVAIAMIVAGSNGMTELFRPDMSSPAAYFTPFRLVQIVVGAVASALFWPIALMPAPEVYRELAGPPSPAS
jgi:hypothetical protein